MVWSDDETSREETHLISAEWLQLLPVFFSFFLSSPLSKSILGHIPSLPWADPNHLWAPSTNIALFIRHLTADKARTYVGRKVKYDLSQRFKHSAVLLKEHGWLNKNDFGKEQGLQQWELHQAFVCLLSHISSCHRNYDLINTWANVTPERSEAERHLSQSLPQV